MSKYVPQIINNSSLKQCFVLHIFLNTMFKMHMRHYFIKYAEIWKLDKQKVKILISFCGHIRVKYFLLEGVLDISFYHSGKYCQNITIFLGIKYYIK